MKSEDQLFSIQKLEVDPKWIAYTRIPIVLCYGYNFFAKIWIRRVLGMVSGHMQFSSTLFANTLRDEQSQGRQIKSWIKSKSNK